MPQFIIQLTQNNHEFGGWTWLGFISFTMSLIMLVKDGCMITIFMSRILCDGISAHLRPS